MRSVLVWLVGAVLCWGIAAVAHATTIASNLGNAYSGSVVVQGDLWVAQSFTTDGTTYSLDSITVSALGTDTSSDIEFRLYDDAGGQPGSLLNVLTGPGAPSVFANYTYLPTAPIDLGANTKYWIVASVLPGNGDYGWVRTLDVSDVGTGSLGGTVGSGDQGATWGTESTTSALFLDVEGTPVPEPSSLALAALGLTAVGVARRRKVRVPAQEC